MITWTCDRCGHSVSALGIVGREWGYDSTFETLAPGYRPEGIADLCKPCMAVVEEAVRHAGSMDTEGARRHAARNAFGPQAPIKAPWWRRLFAPFAGEEAGDG